MTRKEIAEKALELREAIHELFAISDINDQEVRRAYGENLKSFGEIYEALTHQVFNLARITREGDSHV